MVPNLFDAFLPLLILELLIPPLVRVHRLVFTTSGTMVFIDDNNLINKSRTKDACFKTMVFKSPQKRVIVH